MSNCTGLQFDSFTTIKLRHKHKTGRLKIKSDCPALQKMQTENGRTCMRNIPCKFTNSRMWWKNWNCSGGRGVSYSYVATFGHFNVDLLNAVLKCFTKQILEEEKMLKKCCCRKNFYILRTS